MAECDYYLARKVSIKLVKADVRRERCNGTLGTESRTRGSCTQVGTLAPLFCIFFFLPDAFSILSYMYRQEKINGKKKRPTTTISTLTQGLCVILLL